MINYKKTLKSAVTEVTDFNVDLSKNERWVIKTRFLDAMEDKENDETDFIECLYYFLSSGSIHEVGHEDYTNWYRLLNYFALMFHESEKVRTLIFGFYKTQCCISAWYEFSKPLLRQWEIWKSK